MKIKLTIIILFIVVNISAQNIFIAHRGASFIAPENTVASANLAWELGADAVEIDICLAKDNRIMVIHDKDTKRTCSGKRNMTVGSTPSILLRELDAGVWKDEKYEGEKIPFLSEIIKTVPEGKTLVIEIKSGDDIIPHLSRCIEMHAENQQIVFIAFNWKTIVKTKEEFPDNKCYWLSSSKAAVKKRISDVVKAGVDGINLDNSIVDETIMKLAKESKLEVLSWTIDNPKEAKRITDLGVSGITTNRPKWLKDEMAKL